MPKTTAKPRRPSSRGRSHAAPRESLQALHRLGVDTETGCELIVSRGFLSLPDRSDGVWLREDPVSFIDISGAEIAEVMRSNNARWHGPAIQVSATKGGRCLGIGVAMRKVFTDGTRAVNLTYVVREEARGARLGELLSAIATFDLCPGLAASYGDDDRGVVNVQTRSTNEAGKALALTMGLTHVPEHGFVANLRDGRRIEYLGYDDDLDSFQQRMATRLLDRIEFSERVGDEFGSHYVGESDLRAWCEPRPDEQRPRDRPA